MVRVDTRCSGRSTRVGVTRACRSTQVIVANINMHTALPQRHKPSQLDRMEPLLKDKPQKLGFKIVASPPVPYSMFTGMRKSHNKAPALVAVYDSAIE